MRHLSKSKIIAYRQCPKRLWLEIHRPDLRDDSSSVTAFRIGNEVGDVAREIYDDNGTLIEIETLGFEQAFAKSAALLQKGDAPIFEAGFKAAGALAFADVMLPRLSESGLSWDMIEVKASTGVKDYHRDDIAVQNYVATAAGVDLTSVSLAHVNNAFVYPGDRDYQGLLHEVDFTDEVKSRHGEVAKWIEEARKIAELSDAPEIKTGEQCHQPHHCSFCNYCAPHEAPDETSEEYPLSSLPNFSADKQQEMKSRAIYDLREVPDDYLSWKQLRVKEQSQTGEAYFDAKGAAADLALHGFPSRFLDFETAMFAVPIWKGTRPYQQVPFQFSLHNIDETGTLIHHEFLDLSGSDPSEALTVALIKHCGNEGPVFTYNASFEKRVMRDLGERFPQYQLALDAIIARVIDLLPVARNRYYHPSQHGSWSLKSVLPAICPELSYENLTGVADGSMAVDAFKEAIALETSPEQKKTIEHQLLDYCQLDTLALVEIWKFFRGIN